jgi:hypothetical protein
VTRAAALGAIAAAAGFVLFVKLNDDANSGEWTARGGGVPNANETAHARDVAVQIYAGKTQLEPLGPGDRLSRASALSVGVRNLGQTTAYLLLFAVDSKRVVHWIAPEYTQPNQIPVAVPIPPTPTKQLLPTSVVFEDLAAGELRLVTLLLSAPADISKIEQMTTAELADGNFAARFPNAEVRQFSVQVEGGAN